MTFEEIVKHPSLRLPIQIPNDKICDSNFLENIINDYQNLINRLSEKEFTISGIKTPIKKTNLVRNQIQFSKGILDSFNAYLNGKPSQAFNVLSDTMKARIEKYPNILISYPYLKDTLFYKIRITEDVNQLEHYEMFHIPFEKRAKVKTQRFSIPGFPSLYLGTSLYVCWEELLRPNINNFQASGFVSQKSISVLDLTKPVVETNYYTKSIYKYLITWPLIAACSIKVKEPKEYFKPEYVIPQLLLQWVREKNDGIIGIRYSSTHILDETDRSHPSSVNLVMPVSGNFQNGLCPVLSSGFKIFGPISWQLMELSVGGNGLVLRNKSELKRYPEIEVIKGYRRDYSSSILGKMELHLDGLKAAAKTPSNR